MECTGFIVHELSWADFKREWNDPNSRLYKIKEELKTDFTYFMFGFITAYLFILI